jgi:hypothetical protein
MTFFTTLSTATLFYVFTVLIGKSFPSGCMLPNIKPSTQEFVLGVAALIVLLRFPYREDLPIAPFIMLGVALAAVGLYKFLRELVSYRSQAPWKSERATKNAIIFSTGMFCISFPTLLPLAGNGAVFIQHAGPDLDGHLMSAALFLDGFTRGNHIGFLIDSIGTSKWWSLKSTWNLPDFREAVGLEFVLRSNRYGHGVLSSFIARITSREIWFGMLVLQLVSLWGVAVVIFEKFSRYQTKRSVMYAMPFLMICLAQTYIIMAYEGITGQLVASGMVIFLMLNAKILVCQKLNIKQIVFISVVLSAIASTFGEGLQILAVFCCAWLLVLLLSHYQPIFGNGELYRRHAFKNIILVLFGFIAISPSVAVDFVTWSYFRLRQNFSGGILHLDWDLFSLLLSIPEFKLNEVTQGWHLYYSGSAYINAFEIVLLIILAVLLKKRDPTGPRDDFGTTIAALLTILLFVLVGHKYAFWKCVVLVQPLILYNMFVVYSDKIRSKLTFGMCFGLLMIALGGWLTLLQQYMEVGRLVPAKDYVLQGARKDIALLMPSNSPYYLKLGATSPLYLINRPAWGMRQPNFNINGATKLKVALFYSCNAEGEFRCNQIINNTNELMPDKLYLTDLFVSDIVNRDGVVDADKVKELVQKYFGIAERLQF